MSTTVQGMDERLNRLDDILKSCQLSGTDQKNQHLQRQFRLISRACGVSGHKAAECSRPSCGISLRVIQGFNNNPRNYNNFPNRRYNKFYSQREERDNGMGANTFQPRAIRGGYNQRYYNSGVGRNYN